MINFTVKVDNDTLFANLTHSDWLNVLNDPRMGPVIDCISVVDPPDNRAINYLQKQRLAEYGQTLIKVCDEKAALHDELKKTKKELQQAIETAAALTSDSSGEIYHLSAENEKLKAKARSLRDRFRVLEDELRNTVQKAMNYDS